MEKSEGAKMLLEGLKKSLEFEKVKNEPQPKGNYSQIGIYIIQFIKNIGGILITALIVLMILSYYAYTTHWFVDIFSGKCYWWSLGFICTSG